jgi:flagellar biosynthesis GTPase FlhF
MNEAYDSTRQHRICRTTLARNIVAGILLLGLGAAIGAIAYHFLPQPRISALELRHAFARGKTINISINGIPETIVNLTSTRAVTRGTISGQSIRILYSLENGNVSPLLCYPDDSYMNQAVATVGAILQNPQLSSRDKDSQLSAYRNLCNDDALLTLALYSCPAVALNQLYGQTALQYERMALLSAPKLYIGAKLLDAGIKSVQDYQKRSEAARLHGYSVENPYLTWRLDENGKYVLADTVPPEAVQYESEKRERQARAEEQRRQFEASTRANFDQARAQVANLSNSARNALNQAAQGLNQAATDLQRNASRQQRQNAQQAEALRRQAEQAAQNLNRIVPDWQRGVNQWQQKAAQDWQQFNQQLNKSAQDLNRQLNQGSQQSQWWWNNPFQNQQKK